MTVVKSNMESWGLKVVRRNRWGLTLLILFWFGTKRMTFFIMLF